MSSPPAPLGQYVLRTVEERGVRFVRLWFVDVLGLLKSLAIPVSELEQALEEGVGIDGSSLEGTARRGERDALQGAGGEAPREIGVDGAEHRAHHEDERLQQTPQAILSLPLMILRVGVRGISATTTNFSGSLFFAMFFPSRY